MHTLETLLNRIRQCRLCEAELPKEPKPILRAHPEARLLIVGQAPGIRVHETGIPWNDPSGNRLRKWSNIDLHTFYDIRKIAIIPMGYCYPGTGSFGDYPPKKACAKYWLPSLLSLLPQIQCTLLIGQYAQAYYLGKQRKKTLTQTVRAFKTYLPKYLPLPHPSPRNQRWLHRNPWFLKEVIPFLQEHCYKILSLTVS